MTPMELTIAEIDSLETLIEAIGACERAYATTALAAARLATAGAWQADGATSMTAWLAHHARMSHLDATRLLRDGKFLNNFDAVADSATTGRLSAAQINALRNAVTKPTTELFADHHHHLIESLTTMNITDSETLCKQWRQQAEAVADMPEPKIPDQTWTTSRMQDGTIIGRFVLDPEAAAQLEQALGTATHFDGADDTRPTNVRNADAATDIFAFFNANHNHPGTPRHRPHVELHIHTTNPTGSLSPELTTNPLTTNCATTTDGQLLPTWATDAFLCDCIIHRVLRAGATILDYGRSTRSVPTNLYRAVIARDHGCRFTGCNRKPAWCDAHHIRWWRHHGETKLDNLLLLCHYHHRLIHRDRWHITLHPDNSTTFTAPDGRTHTSQPPTHTLDPPILSPPTTQPSPPNPPLINPLPHHTRTAA